MKIFQDLAHPHSGYKVVDDDGNRMSFDQAEAVASNGGVWREPPPTKFEIWSPLIFLAVIMGYLAWAIFRP